MTPQKVISRVIGFSLVVTIAVASLTVYLASTLLWLRDYGSSSVKVQLEEAANYYSYFKTLSTSIVQNEFYKSFFFNMLKQLLFVRDCEIDDVHFPSSAFSGIKFISRIQQLLKEQYSLETNIKMIDLIRGLPKPLSALHNTSKDSTNEALQNLQKYYSDHFIKGKDNLPPGYCHFGTNTDVEAKELLKEFLRCNPFFASAMKMCHPPPQEPSVDSVESSDNASSSHEEVEYHINSYESSPDLATWFSKFIDCYDAKFPRINAVFDADLTLKSFNVLKLRCNKDIKDQPEALEMSEDEAMWRLLFLLTFYFECLHTLMHIYHALMISGLVEASEGSPVIKAFAKSYEPNVLRKYIEVKVLLLSPNAGLTGQIYKGNRGRLLPLMGEAMKVIGNCHTCYDFLQRFLLRDLLRTEGSSEMLQRSDILSEFFKHVDLSHEFAAKLDETFQTQDPLGRESTTKRLKTYMNETGDNGPKVKSIRTWIDLMGVTGILHGFTQSATRLCTILPVFKYFNEDKSTFDTLDVTRGDGLIFLVFFGTMIGGIDDLDIYQQNQTNAAVNSLMEQFCLRASVIRKAYYEKLKLHPDFKGKSWIWADCYPNMMDNRQLTLTTYH